LWTIAERIERQGECEFGSGQSKYHSAPRQMK
jgi:hypothetical protein